MDCGSFFCSFCLGIAVLFYVPVVALVCPYVHRVCSLFLMVLFNVLFAYKKKRGIIARLFMLHSIIYHWLSFFPLLSFFLSFFFFSFGFLTFEIILHALLFYVSGHYFFAWKYRGRLSFYHLLLDFLLP